MAPLVLEGATLGKRHQHYNQLLKDVAPTNDKPAKIDYNKTDIENLFNIDLASKIRDLEYILDVLKGEDMLYVSRAIKRSNWLYTDAQYAHIIDPEYLHSELFPQMMPKASSKFLLHIRLTLKNEAMVEKFFQYFKEKNLKTAIKWLPNCPMNAVEEAVKKHNVKISPDIFGRLCRRSPTILEIFLKSTDNHHYRTEHLKAVMFLLTTHTDLYLDALEKNDRYNMPTMTKKHTEIVMKNCYQRIIDNFEKYIYCINIDTFAKTLKKEDIKPFLRTQLENKELKRWFDQDRLGNFIKYMPKEEKSEFMKQCIDRTVTDTSDSGCITLKCSAVAMSCRGGGGIGSASTYRWYKYAPFGVAFPELKKLIRAESNPDERNAMLMILVENASKNLTHIQNVLQYYRERHINEPFRFKVQFVNDLLHKTHPQLYDETIWSILDELFRSMEVYIESENNVQTCIKAIIAYKVTHDQEVPAIIEQKFTFDLLRNYEKKLKGVLKEKVFNYLFNLLLTKLDKHVISHQTEFGEYVNLLKQGLDLLNVWKKDLSDYPLLINKIKDCVKIKKEKGWTTSLMPLYDIKKSWKRYIFEDSLAISPSEVVCMNALKHDPEMFIRHKDELDKLRYNDSTSIEKVLRKLRIYWPHTIASEWTAAYRNRLDKPGGHKALIRGLYCLLNQQELLEFLKKYEPQETKINWADTDELQMSLRKNIAQSMHTARPQVSPDAILWYAKGDYVQFTQPALSSILYNLRSSHSRDVVLKLLNGIVTLQKHGIRLAFAKLSTSEMKKIFEDVWKTTKNSSVRAVLFQTTNEMLCKEPDVTLIAEVWELMQTFIDSLSAEEDKATYNSFGKVANIHSSIKAAYCKKSYKVLKSLPSKIDCQSTLQKIKEEISNIIEELDYEFIANIIEEFANDILIKSSYGYQHRHDMNVLTKYLLCVVDESDQTAKFNKVFVPLMEKSLASWNKVNDRQLIVKQNFEQIVVHLLRSIDYPFLKSKANPSPLYRNILKKLESTLPATQNIILFQQLKLSAAFVDILYKNKPDSMTEKSQLYDLYSASTDDITKIIIKYLKEDVAKYDTLIYRPFARALESVFDFFEVNVLTKLKFLIRMMAEKDFVPVYLVTIKMLPTYFDDDEKALLKEIRDLITSHPSPLVQINYFMKFGTDPLPVPEEK
ncbi:uncharacterized protein LOC134799406 [Cydia splendana]|uniref:uncharacterized protein LOC134799406 n=1 Tax=Cydia splendana TaxID=1100963 RepID=UPI002121C0B7